MKITICSSMAFYKEFVEIRKQLESLGHEVQIPDLEFGNGTEDDTSVGHYFDTRGGLDAFPLGHDIWKKKGEAIHNHFKKILWSDAILVINLEKKGIQDYIGANTFLEIGFAFGNHIKVFVLNQLPEVSAYTEELRGMSPIILGGDLSKIK